MSRDRESADRIVAGLPPTNGSEPEGPILITVGDVEPEPIRWLWKGRIPLEMITVLDGDPDLGKSTVTLDLAARVTTATPFPDGTPVDCPGPVVLLSAEDLIAKVIRPRLAAAGADMSKVHCLDAITFLEETGTMELRPPVLPGDLAHLETAIRSTGAVMVVVDPLSAYLSERVDAYKDQHVRRALMPLARMAERAGVAVIIVRHLSKSGGTNALYRGGGSIGIIGAARAGLLVAPDPEDDTRRILAVSKENLAAKPPALAYRLVPDELHDCGRIVWEGSTSHTASDLLVSRDPEEVSARDEAVDFLRSYLALGTEKAQDVKKEATKAGISERTLARARGPAGVVSQREGFGKGSVVWWSLSILATEAP